MKKSFLLILAIALVAMPSCKNKDQKTEEEQQASQIDITDRQQIAEENLKAEAEKLIETASKIKPAPFASAKQDGRITLTAKEKLVKPTYLLKGDVVKDLVTFSQKYRVISMLAVDKAIADLYEVPGNEINDAILVVLTDLGDEAISNFASTPWIDLETSKDAMRFLAEDEYAAGRQIYFWEGVAASIVEQVYVITRNIDKFMPMFNDQTASDFTFNLICLQEGLKSVIELNPEMESLNESLAVLYKLNAISVDQLREQLTEIKDEVEVVRESLLK